MASAWETVIKNELTQLLVRENKVTDHTDVDVFIDDALVQYMTSFLEDCERSASTSCSSSETSLDENEVYEVAEMIRAYVPDFGAIETCVVSQWLRHMIEKLTAKSQKGAKSECYTAADGELPGRHLDLRMVPKANSPTKSEKPHGDLAGSRGLDAEVKQTILSRHGLVDDDPQKNHKPTANPKPTGEQSKLRYLDGKVVSSRGDKDRYLLMKEEESEEMKKTYINLKPARQYRFH